MGPLGIIVMLFLLFLFIVIGYFLFLSLLYLYYQSQLDKSYSITSLTTWMTTDIDRNLPLNELTIPGSHDSLTYHWDQKFNPFEITVSYWAKTQSLTIYEQLLAGTRYFDVRIIFDREQNTWYGIHGDYVNKNVTYESALEELAEFCKLYPKEIIIWNLDVKKSDGRFPKELHEKYLDQWVISYEPKGFGESVESLNKRGQVIFVTQNSESWKIEAPYSESEKINNPEDGMRVLREIYSSREYPTNVLPVLQWITVYDIKNMDSIIYSVFYQSKQMNNALFTEEVPPVPKNRKEHGVIMIDFVKESWNNEILKRNIMNITNITNINIK